MDTYWDMPNRASVLLRGKARVVSGWALEFWLKAAAACLLWVLAASGVQAQLTDEQVAKIPAGPQPVPFSHMIHVGQNGIECQYCHYAVQRSSSAGVPPLSVCVGCHQVVGTQLTEVRKVLGYWERQEPIPWVKVHDLPDFANFPHNKHVNARNEVFPQGVPCQACHGDVEKQHVVKKQSKDFGKMGWCLECHLGVPGALERKRAIAASIGGLKTKNWKHPGTERARAHLTDCLTCHQ